MSLKNGSAQRRATKDQKENIKTVETPDAFNPPLPPTLDFGAPGAPKIVSGEPEIGIRMRSQKISSRSAPGFETFFFVFETPARTLDPCSDKKLQSLKKIVAKNRFFGAQARTPEPGSVEKS